MHIHTLKNWQLPVHVGQTDERIIHCTYIPIWAIPIVVQPVLYGYQGQCWRTGYKPGTH